MSSDPLRVLFVCTANICRSPHLELTARQLAGEDSGLEFASAGTHGFVDHPMDEVMARTLAPAAGRDGAAASFRSRRLDRTAVAEADLHLFDGRGTIHGGGGLRQTDGLGNVLAV